MPSEAGARPRARRGESIVMPGHQEAQCKRAAKRAAEQAQANEVRSLKAQVRLLKAEAKAEAKADARTIRSLQRELREAKADAIENMNEQAQAIRDLQDTVARFGGEG